MRSWLSIRVLAALALCAIPPAASGDPPAGSSGGGPCVEVQAGNERLPDYDCINQQFRLMVEQQHVAAPAATAPIDARSPSTAVGAANQAAAQQMMGSAFGKSGTPQRPAPPVFVPALPKAGAH